MMILKKDSRQLVRPCRTQKNNKEGFTLQHPHFIDADGSFTLERTLKAAGVRAALAGALRGGFPVQHKR